MKHAQDKVHLLAKEKKKKFKRQDKEVETNLN